MNIHYLELYFNEGSDLILTFFPSLLSLFLNDLPQVFPTDL